MGQAIFVRQKTIHCGKNYREVDLIPYTAEQKRKDKAGRKRGKKEKISAPKQISMNDKNSKRYLTQLLNANFTKEDYHVTLTNIKPPKTVEEAEALCTQFINDVKKERKKLGLPPLKYVRVFSNIDGKAKTPAKPHHHIVMSGGIDRATLKKLWKHGYARVDELEIEVEGTLAPLSKYLVKQGSGKKKWSSSRNLIRPYATNNDSSWSNRTVDKLGREKPGREYWERKFPGWTLIDDDYGKEYIYNNVTATWSVYLKMRRIM